MPTPAALLVLYCAAAAPPPLVHADVLRVLRGEPVREISSRAAFTEALASLPGRRRTRHADAE